MSDTGNVECTRDGHVAIVTIARPEKLNAFTNAMYGQFRDLLVELSKDREIRCILIQSKGDRAFCVGSDIGEFNAAIGQPDLQIEQTRIGRAAMDALTACPHPVVAAIDGICVGGGFQIACACDLRVAGNTSRFGIPVKNLGIFGEIEDLKTMAIALGSSICLDLLLSGRMMEAREASDKGIIHRLVEEGSARNEALQLAHEIAAGAPMAARWHKKIVGRLAASQTVEEFKSRAFDCFEQKDFAEGCAAFLEKRLPHFSGEDGS